MLPKVPAVTAVTRCSNLMVCLELALLATAQRLRLSCRRAQSHHCGSSWANSLASMVFDRNIAALDKATGAQALME
jgi:hypothetical protein